MKNLFVKLVSLMLVVASLLSLTACGSGGHKHAFNQQNATADYLASTATCTAPAKYYYSCECGEKSDSTFDVGSAGHDYIDHVCKFCNAEEVYTQGLKYVVGKNGTCTILGFQEGATIPMSVIIPQKIENAPVKTIAASAFENSTFTNIVLPEGLEMIMTGAFKNSALATLTIPSTVTTIYQEAFYTKSLSRVTFLVTNGWYRGKQVLKNPNADDMVKPSLMADQEKVASELRDYDSRKQYGGANLYWFRVNK